MFGYRVGTWGAALACSLALLAAPTARAQHGHGGHGFGHGGHGFGHGGHGFGHWGHGFGHGLYLGHGHGHFYGLGYGYPGYYPGFPLYASYPAYSVTYAQPVIAAGPAIVSSTVPSVATESVPAPVATGEAPAAKPNAARIEDRLPDPDAEVWVDGRRTRLTGAVRTLASPELTPGKAYTYTVTASWTRDGQHVTDDRVVEVRAGMTTTVDFAQAGDTDELSVPKERVPGKPPLDPQ